MSWLNLFGNKIRAKDVCYQDGKTLDDSKKTIIVERVTGKTVTVDTSNIRDDGQGTFAFLVAVRNWTANSSGSLWMVHGIQKNRYQSASQIMTAGVSSNVSLSGTDITITFYDANGGGYAIIPLI